MPLMLMTLFHPHKDVVILPSVNWFKLLNPWWNWFWVDAVHQSEFW